MQSTGYFQQEQDCLTDLDRQKHHMRDLVKQAGQGRIEILEGVCVDFNVKIERTRPTTFRS